MGATSWAVPVGVLAAIVGAGFVFTWWWWPRHYSKGVKADMDRVDLEGGGAGGDRSEQRETNREIIRAAMEGRSALKVLEDRGVATDGVGPLRVASTSAGAGHTHAQQGTELESVSGDTAPKGAPPPAYETHEIPAAGSGS